VKDFAASLWPGLWIGLVLQCAVSGCTGAGGPIIAPGASSSQVTFAAPLPRATDVPIGTSIVVTFTAGLDSTTVDTASFLVSGVSGTVTYDSAHRSAIFRPTAALPINTAFTVTLTAAIKGVDQAAITPFSYTFTTGATTDTFGPRGTSVAPTNNAVNVAVGGAITKTFSEPVNPSSVTDSVFSIAGVSGRVTLIGTTAVLTPNSPLSVNTRYIATVTTAVRGLSGDSFPAAETFAFTTGSITDRTRPSVETAVPAPGETASAGLITVVFSEEMNPATVTTATFRVTGAGGGAITGIVYCSGRTAVFYPVTALSASTQYTVTVTTGAKDLSGNALPSDFTFSFWTAAAADSTLPTVARAVPDTGLTAVRINRGIHITFSEAMDPMTINTATFQIVGETGFVTYDPVNRIASFTPFGTLRASTLESVTITRGVRDLSGNAIATQYRLTFRTDTATESAPPNLGAAAGFGVLAGTFASATGTASAIHGDFGTSPGTVMTGFFGTTANEGPTTVNGSVFQGVAVAANAQTDFTNAYNDLASRSADTVLSGIDLAGLTLTPGVFSYAAGAALTNGVVTLDAAGNAGGLFIFRIAGDLTTTGSVRVHLVNGADPSRVFWQVGGSATLGSGAKFVGSILAQNNITLNATTLSRGRALASTGNVTISDSTLVFRP
jgi:hypothetical protein